MIFPWLAVVLVPAVVSWSVIVLLRRSAVAKRLADHPNERSLHAQPKPRVGGIGLMAGALPLAAWVAVGELEVVLVCTVALAIVSLVDDARPLPVGVRLSAHLLAAVATVIAVWAAPGWIAAGVAALAIAWMANLFNFMDGADGLAGGMAAIGFAALAWGAWAGGNASLAFTCAAIASASVGFLVCNFPPARVFMGDAGSVPLGYLAGALGLYGAVERAWPGWFPVLVFSPFIVDATVTLARRALKREPVWRAHRSHFYQRLVLAGWSHRRLALWAYALMAAAAASALFARAEGPMLPCGIISIWAAAYAVLLVAIERYLRRAGGADGKSTGQPAG